MILDMNGKVISKIEGLEKYSRELQIFTECGCVYQFYHDQVCCEDVSIEDFEIDDDLTGALIISSEEVSNEEFDDGNTYESCTWTFYKIETTKGGLWVRWLGESNGYYGEEVDVVKRVI